MLSSLGALASPHRAETPVEERATKNRADFAKSRQNPCPGGLIYDHVLCFSPMRGLSSVEVDTDEIDSKSPVHGGLLLTTGGYTVHSVWHVMFSISHISHIVFRI